MPGAEAVLAGTVAQPRHLAVPALLAPAGESGLARDKVAGYHWPDDEEDRARLASTRLYRLCGRTSARTTSSAAPELLLDPESMSSVVEDDSQATRCRSDCDLEGGDSVSGWS